MKVLVNTPDLRILGGVANHYLGLREFWTEKVHYNVVGRRKCGVPGVLMLPYDLLKFIFKLIFSRPDVVIMNPSLGKSALVRDFFFLRIAKLFRIKTAVFVHGFNMDYAEIVDKKWISKHLNRADLIFVLAEQFRNLLVSWGVKTRIELTTTKVDDKLINNFDIDEKVNTGNLLFLARIEKAKGIYIAVDAYRILKHEFGDLTLTIAGDGSELNNVRQYIEQHNVEGVRILGSVSGRQLVETYASGSISILPSYGEGMPTSVLEAMAFGLPVFTRNVGGLKDFFVAGQMGFITDSLNAEDFANAIKSFLSDQELYRQVSRYNHHYACEHFLASKVAALIENELANI